jgi:hypothetical protein
MTSPETNRDRGSAISGAEDSFPLPDSRTFAKQAGEVARGYQHPESPSLLHRRALASGRAAAAHDERTRMDISFALRVLSLRLGSGPEAHWKRSEANDETPCTYIHSLCDRDAR